MGDDCAVLKLHDKERLLVTTDMLVQGTHFCDGSVSPKLLGYKSLAVSVSDIAAMGAEPRSAFLSLGLGASTGVGWVEAFRDGFFECANEFGVDLLGGDTVSNQKGICISVTLLGWSKADELVMRSGANPGDGIYLGRDVGAAAAALKLLDTNPFPCDDVVLLAQLQPKPQVALGRFLARNKLASSMIDVSDGVWPDLHQLCRSSGVGARILAERLPVMDQVRSLAAIHHVDVLDWALGGGEDYCLLFSVPARKENKAATLCAEQLDQCIFRIGEITQACDVLLKTGGTWQERKTKGFEHFPKSVHPR
jgi:thiamine-monophosphate kinase